MSQNDETASGPGRDEQSTGSVYDFLYHDARRVASFLAQFDPSGHLTGVKQTESAESGSGMKFGGTASANIAVARGAAAMEDQRTVLEREALERTYDPLWANARAILDFLDERGMIGRDLSSARIGQVVLVSGNLGIFDVSMMKTFWDNPSFRSILATAIGVPMPPAISPPTSGSERRRQQREVRNQTELPTPASMALDLLKYMPHAILASIKQDGVAVWSSLREDSLIGSSADLLLKHGVGIQGTWSMLGILDAVPATTSKAVDDDIAQQNVADSLGALGKFAGQFGPAIRRLLGRPDESYGMTPLLIFRQIST